MPRKRGDLEREELEREELVKEIVEEPSYRCPICQKLEIDIPSDLYNRIELYVHLRLHKLDHLREELVKAITGKDVDDYENIR